MTRTRTCAGYLLALLIWDGLLAAGVWLLALVRHWPPHQRLSVLGAVLLLLGTPLTLAPLVYVGAIQAVLRRDTRALRADGGLLLSITVMLVLAGAAGAVCGR